ncbi:hypothetical protein Bhyg_17602 [Pseudolycoriella hygida]|uniref:Uncharacterized protein n=1 Tax=Pseudolycoriella hygida TaxID=35572 RepID=A0A9Q0RTF2_9DIPT|nr:hypothetical protein Bhyg_17602 [Pseudolycoriella hygida]
MDLQLNGSQINLATRDKRPAPAVQYPFNHRPGSANVATTINRSSLTLRGRTKRPQSADTLMLRNNLKSGYNFLSENSGEKLKV